jgi:hypothetical protein
MWNPEVSTSKSGTGSGMSYGDMKDFAAGFDGFPGFSGKPGKESSLPEPAELEAVKSWWQDLIAF